MSIQNIKAIIPDLTPVEVFVNHDGPKFYSCHDRTGQLYLAYWIDSKDDFTEWLYVRISATRYAEMKAGRLSPERALRDPEDEAAHLIRFGPKVYEVSDLAAQAIDPEWLPPSDYYLPAINAELSLSPLPAVQDARASFRHVLDVAISQGARKYEVGAIALGRLLDAVQNTVFALSPENSEETRKVSEVVKAKNELFATAAFASSFGIRLKSNEQMFSSESETEAALHRLLSLFQLCNDPASVSSGLQEYGILARSRFKHLIKLLDESNASVRVEWASPSGQGEKARLTLSEIRTTSALLSAKHDVTTATIEKIGTLVGVNVQANSFALFAEEELYKGTLAESLKHSSFHVPSRVSAKLEATCDIDPLTDRTKWTYVLLSCREEA